MLELLYEEYTDLAKLHIVPKPDQIIRVFTKFKFSANYVDCGGIQIRETHRVKTGKLIVEWGGSEIVPDSPGNELNKSSKQFIKEPMNNIRC